MINLKLNTPNSQKNNLLTDLLARILFILVLLSGLFFIACEPRIPEGLAPGNRPPDFKAQVILNTESEKESQASISFVGPTSFKGQVILVNFWASWCAPCLVEMPSLEKLYQKYKEQGFTVLAVAVDDTIQQISEIQKDYQLTFPIALDTKASVRSKYQITGFPETVLVKKDGTIALINDPKAGLVNKIRGERDWNSTEYQQLIESLLK